MRRSIHRLRLDQRALRPSSSAPERSLPWGRHLVIPPGTPTLSCHDCVVFAGFWNTHIHFSEPKWNDAAHLPAAQLNQQLQQMLTHSGFTTVVDTGSDPGNTLSLRRRIESGEVLGPHIYTAGAPLYPPKGIPYYSQDLPPRILSQLGQPATPEEAEVLVERNTALGTDIVKLFTGSYVARGHVVPMPLPVARAAVEAGHRHGELVFAHTSNLEGVRVASESGVDVLAHAPDPVKGIDDALIAQLASRHMAYPQALFAGCRYLHASAPLLANSTSSAVSSCLARIPAFSPITTWRRSIGSFTSPANPHEPMTA
jgi:hypothetical protein